MNDAYITACGAHLPGPPVHNEDVEARLGMIGGTPSRLRPRMLAANGIECRHYAIDCEGRTTMLNEELAERAIRDALDRRGVTPADVGMIATGTTQGDLPVPGFASMVHGRLGGGPVETLSAGGVCGSGFSALRAAANAVRLGEHDLAVAVGSELVSRIMKATRFDPSDRKNLDAEFLRWMLSDGAGAVVIEPEPRPSGLSLRIDWTHLVSHAHEHDVCMYAGARTAERVEAGRTWLDQPCVADAERAGAINLRQDVRRLPAMVALGVNEYVRLTERGMVDPDRLDHVLCHYSSELFRSDIFELMAESGVMVPESKWFSNLRAKGNTGSASIFVMLEEAFNSGRFAPGDRILLMVPESGRFSVAFGHLTVVEADQGHVGPPLAPTRVRREEATPSAPPEPAIVAGPADRARLLARLADVWAEFEQRLAMVPIVGRIEAGEATLDDYRCLLRNLRQQVADGARWITRAASNLGHEKIELRAELVRHAATEQLDFQMLERDYCRVGGDLADIQGADKNIGSAALSAFVFHRADQPDPLDLLGAMFVIEGLGARKALGWARLLESQLGLEPDQVSFLDHHGRADEDHTAQLHEILTSEWITAEVADEIVRTARTVGRLYVLQLEELDEGRR